MSEHAGGQESKARRRLAEQLAEQKAAEAKRRKQAWAGAFAAVAVVAVLITVFVMIGQRGGDEPTEQAAGEPSATPTQGAPQDAPPAPQLPEGADPALGTQPEAKAGEGKLDKLVVTPLIEGTGPKVEAGQSITVNYIGVFYENGEEFDSSWSRGEPATFPIGVGQVIEGWDRGLVGVTVGSRVQLDIPAEQAYGDGAGGRPGGPLRFVVDILAAQ
ncbi:MULTISPECIES: FKBP-type peptidyl-prolyl cis-trans isomerase [Micromonospora]|uniref:Peptidyl-prolyl cis-trans isomerase n=1 Tax=Micromonospora maris TaxID=1003110 RepID=A0A9X0I6P1_9ACTN|nr:MULTISPECIES: FKBP-type peptidyl-prolyl cis-trans isomerase [Micromonospora]AEB42425.1 peptidylprolyl isomerase, FKBP-type [Micromonospora maris AB-18-032]KUJ47891.1 peptidylprolyl isomerase [Micromonospora maris]